jgi:hypothetical protein
MTYACCLDDGDACKGAAKKQMVAGQVSFKLSTVDILTAWLPGW